jgi:hypothetical protein
MAEQLELTYSAEASAIISGGTDAIRGQTKRQHREFKVSTAWETVALVEKMIAEGRHSREWQTVCDGCRQWVSGIFHVDPISKKHYCRDCAAKQGIEVNAPQQQTAQSGAANAKNILSAHLISTAANLPF